MSAPLLVSIPHRLGKDEAVRRLKSGLSRWRAKASGQRELFNSGRAGSSRRFAPLGGAASNARTNYSSIISVDEEVWTGDRLVLRVRALGQSASGVIDVLDDCVRLEVTLPWLLARFTERVVPTIRKEATLMLEKK